MSEPENAMLTKMSDVLSGRSFSVLNLNLESSARPPASPEVAAQALAAGVNAASGGKLIPAGFEVSQDFNLTVHDFVRVDLLDSYIKYTTGATQYNHKGNVTINATDVHLKAGTIAVNADEEKNTVHAAKKMSRYVNVSSGTYTMLQTPWKNRSALIVSGDFSAGNASVGGARIGTAAQMSHYGTGRHGGGLVSLDNDRSKWEKSANMVSLGATVIWLILSGG
ncbi:MAG TPA: hypothetical protein VEA17_06365 [Bordetella sp.]|nr:hypothetical protein [Bordetella sp.]